jgi:hypothetical protein
MGNHQKKKKSSSEQLTKRENWNCVDWVTELHTALTSKSRHTPGPNNDLFLSFYFNHSRNRRPTLHTSQGANYFYQNFQLSPRAHLDLQIIEKVTFTPSNPNVS